MFSIPVGIVYRPNSAKVKNLKTKDYLGKARLIAAADQGNTFTGFAGSEAKKNAIPVDTSKDDRPPDSISFAASNLVRPGLQSRGTTRQQSEPPVNRNMFPPTPPPDHDQAKSAFVPPTTSTPSARPIMTARANSVRNQTSRPERLNGISIDRSSHTERIDLSKTELPSSIELPEPLKIDHPARPERLDLSKAALNKELPRLGTVRTASEPRGPTRKYSSPRSARDREPTSSRGRLFMETTPLRHGDGAEADIDEYPEELYDLYRPPNNQHPDRLSDSQQPPIRNRRPSNARQRERSHSRQRPRPISEDEEAEDPPSNTSSLSEFEILNKASSLSRPAPPPSRRTGSRSRGTSRSRQPLELKNMRVKVHSGDDTRYIMVTPSVAFPEFVDRVREKFGIRVRFKLKVRDEGDLITMADGDDWDMAVQAVKKEAAREEGEMGKMEVRVSLFFRFSISPKMNLVVNFCGLG